MAIAGISQDEFKEILRENIFPSREIESIEHLFGRERQVNLIERALNSAGRQIFIHGERGVGKTSLAKTSANLFTASGTTPIIVPCGTSSTFSAVITHVVSEGLKGAKKDALKSIKGNIGISGLFNLGGGVDFNVRDDANIENIGQAISAVSALDLVHPDQKIVVVDEFDKISTEEDRRDFAEFINSFASSDSNVRFIFCGIGRNVDDIIGNHLSVGRKFEAVALDHLNHDALWEILRTTADKLKVSIPDEMLTRIGIVSHGFPYFTHLIGDCLFWEMWTDEADVTNAVKGHYEIAINEAVRRSEPELLKRYEQATQKLKHTTQYEHALWALADRIGTRRKLDDIFASYKSFSHRFDREMDRDKLQSRLHSLRAKNHGRAVINHGASNFSFSEGMLRAYSRLRAEAAGIELMSDPV